jgi:hypothetical protein
LFSRAANSFEIASKSTVFSPATQRKYLEFAIKQKTTQNSLHFVEQACILFSRAARIFGIANKKHYSVFRRAAKNLEFTNRSNSN